MVTMIGYTWKLTRESALTAHYHPRVSAVFMDPETSENLPDEARLALAHTGLILRSALTIFFEFDARLARIVAATTEPMLGQMRLAWWRDTLAQSADQRPSGDQVLDAIGERWGGAEDALIAVVDGWEHMLSDPPLQREAAEAFGEGRAQGLAGLARLIDASDAEAKRLKDAGRLWAIADAVSHTSPGEDRDTLLNLGQGLPAPQKLAAPFRGVAVLAALGSRALEAGGAPLMSGRGAALVALRAGLLGR